MNVLITLEDEADDGNYYFATIVYEKDDFKFRCDLDCENRFNSIDKWNGLLAKFNEAKSYRIQFGDYLFLDITDKDTSGLILTSNINTIQISFSNETFVDKVINPVIKFLEENPDAKFY